MLVDYEIIDGSAVRGEDFVAQGSGTIRFNKEKNYAAIEVCVLIEFVHLNHSINQNIK